MKQILITLSITAALTVISCRPGTARIEPGLYKIDKIELHKNDQPGKVVDTSCQYWSFNSGQTGISIFNRQGIQQVLQIKMEEDRFSSYDSNGILKDTYIIHSINRQRLELTSPHKLEDNTYYILYYLDKVDDSLAQTVQAEFR